MSELSLSADQTLTAERFDVPGEETPAWVALAMALLGILGAGLTATLVVDPSLETQFMSRQGDIVEQSGDPFRATTSNPEEDSSASELTDRAGDRRPTPVQTAVTSSTPLAKEASEMPANTAESPALQQAPASASVSLGADAEPAISSTNGLTDNTRFGRPRRSAVQADNCAPLFVVRFTRGATEPVARYLQAKIAKLSGWLETHPQALLQLDGHTDKFGSDELNMLLSYRRAKAVAALLTDSGVPSGQLALGAYGKNLPAKGLPPGSAQNRRVSMHVEGVPECTADHN